MKLPKILKRVSLVSHGFTLGVFTIVFVFIFVATGFVVANGQTLGPNDSHMVNLYIEGQTTIVPTRATNVKEFLEKMNIKLYEADLVEPGLYSPITQDDFNIQVYRARPVTIIDGSTVRKVLSPHTSAKLVVEQAGFVVYPEDNLIFTTASNFTNEMVLGEKLIIDRAVSVNLSLYGSPTAVYRTQADTVGSFLQERGIALEDGATVVPSLDTLITDNTAIFISKYGKTVVMVEEQVQFDIESTPDPTKSNGVVTVIKPGVMGKKQVVYELVLNGGLETGRTKLQEVLTVLPQKQQQTIGTKPSSGLTQSKGVNIFTDSKGVTHRETYYDLPMSNVMQHCDSAGFYTVRGDGAKVDKDGYVIVAANLNIYPRCAVVETSIGLGKVYDTGSFALMHPYGFDLATDWSKEDGI
jgi:uncharacterized protein YabE (DUF348 family)